MPYKQIDNLQIVNLTEFRHFDNLQIDNLQIDNLQIDNLSFSKIDSAIPLPLSLSWLRLG